MKYNFLNEEEAEARFEKRHKTLNLFSVMLSKKLKSKQEGEEEEDLPGEAGEGKEKSKGRAKKDKLVNFFVCCHFCFYFATLHASYPRVIVGIYHVVHIVCFVLRLAVIVLLFCSSADLVVIRNCSAVITFGSYSIQIWSDSDRILIL